MSRWCVAVRPVGRRLLSEVNDNMPIATAAPGVAERLAVARRIIGLAGDRARGYFERYDRLSVETKTSRQDVVSIADRDVEDLIRKELRAAFPLDGIFGEERGGEADNALYTWVIDPIDGTACFLHGLASWCVVISLVGDGRTLAGVILDPMSGRLYQAVAGDGAWCDGQRLSVDRKTPIGGGLFALGASAVSQGPHMGHVVEGLLGAGGVFMRNGSAALSLAHVAAGHYLGFYEPRLSSWDCLAGLLLVQEAGGVVDDFLSANGLSGKGAVFAAAPQVAEAFLGLTSETH